MSTTRDALKTIVFGETLKTIVFGTLLLTIASMPWVGYKTREWVVYEIRDKKEKGQIDNFLSQYDTNCDGALDRQELGGYLDKFDKNENGMLDGEELRDFIYNRP